MATARQMYERVQNLDIIDLVGQSMLEEKEPIVALLVEQQQAEHVNGAGKALKPYSPYYRLRKQRMGKSGDVDYDLTGAMHSEMNLTVSNGEYEINSPSTTDDGELK